MDFEFDKEIDSLLRQTAARSETAQTFAAHPDADEISLFAENALPAKARAGTVAHLAECARCRKILSNLIPFNAETEGENALLAARENEVVTAADALAIPWYRRLFAFPQITLAMGALALVFGGIIAFVALQSFQQSSQSRATIAQTETVTGERPLGAAGATSSDEAAAPAVGAFTSNSSANTANTNSAVANSNAAAASIASSNNAAAAAASNMSSASATPALPELKPATEAGRARTDNRFMLDGAGNSNAAALTQPSIAAAAPAAPPPAKSVSEKARTTDSATAAVAEKDKNEKEDKTSAAGTAPAELQEAAPAATRMMAKKSAKAQPADETRGVGGKTFRRVGGIWFDAVYGSQQQRMIRRGTEDYRKLDSGLRSIAENLSGTVVVVWKGKAYRIQ